jgi:tetratricopeptide (TPR) repeat protein
MMTPAHFPLNQVGNRGLSKIELGRSLTWLALFYTGHFDRLDSLPSPEARGNVPRALLQFHWMSLRWLEGDYEGVKTAYADLGCPVEFVPAETPLSPRQVAERQICLAAANNRAVTLITQEGLGQLPASALDGATAPLASIVEVAPGLTTAWYNLGRAYLYRGRWDKAVHALDKAVQQNPNLAVAWAALSQACTEAGDLARARDAANRAERLNSGPVAAYLAQGRYLLAVNQLQEAERTLGQALQFATDETTRRRSREAALREGPQANPRRADFTAAWARRNDAAVARVHLARARVFLRQGEIESQPPVLVWLWRLIIGQPSPLEKAESEIQLAAVTHPEWSAVRRLQAQLLIARGALDDAVAMLRVLQEEDPQNLELYLDLVEVLRRQWREHRWAGRTTEAQQKLAEIRAQYQLLIDRGVAPARGYFGLGDAAQEIEEWDTARQSYLQAVEIDAAYAEAYLRLAQVELQTPDEPLALTYLDRALAAAAEEGPVAVVAYCERGEILLEQHLRAQIAGGEGPLEEAQKAFETAHALDGRAVRALNGLGRIAYENGDVAGAENLYRQAQTMAARNFDTLYGLGRVYEARGQSHAARDYLFQAAQMNPASITARYHLGVAEYALLDAVLARQYLQWVQEACANLEQQKRPLADDIEACAGVEDWLARLSGQ